MPTTWTRRYSSPMTMLWLLAGAALGAGLTHALRRPHAPSLAPPVRADGDATAELEVGLSRVLAAVGNTTHPPPGGGSVAAAGGALAAALTQMVAGLSVGRRRYTHVVSEMQQTAQRAAALSAELSVLVGRDAAAYAAVGAAYRLPRATEEEAAARAAAIQRAMLPATETPLDIAAAACAVTELAADVAERGNSNAVADAAVAALLAESVCRAAALTVRANVAALNDLSAARRLERAAIALATTASAAAARATAAAERSC